MSFKKYPKIETLGHEDTREIFAFADDLITIEEEFDGIYQNYNFIDFKEMRSIVAKECLKIIKQLMQESVKHE